MYLNELRARQSCLEIQQTTDVLARLSSDILVFLLVLIKKKVLLHCEWLFHLILDYKPDFSLLR